MFIARPVQRCCDDQEFKVSLSNFKENFKEMLGTLVSRKQNKTSKFSNKVTFVIQPLPRTAGDLHQEC